VEHPGNLSFDNTVRFATGLGACVDINDDSTTVLRNKGFNVQRFHLGYSRLWDVWKGDQESPRPIDITYMGTTDSRRNPILASYSDDLAPYDCRLFLPPHEPMVRSRPDFLMGKDKLEHLARTKVILNLHRGGSRALEWVRVLEAICNGCVVVSERSSDDAPLIPGEHFEVGSSQSLAKLAVALLEDSELASRLRSHAYGFVRDQMSMRPSAELLLEVAESLLPRQTRIIPAQTNLTNKLASQNLSNLYSHAQRPQSGRKAIRRFPDHHVAVDVTTILTAHHNDPSPWRAIRSLSEQTALGMTLLVASSGQPFDVSRLAEKAIGASTIKLGRVVEHDRRLTRGYLRNQLLDISSSDLTLVLDSTHECSPRFLEQLLLQLRRNPHVQAAYCLMREDGDISNELPLERERIMRQPYLGGAVLVRTAALRAMNGYDIAARSTAEADQDFWKRFVEHGFEAILVPQILVRHEVMAELDTRFLSRRPVSRGILSATA
jgi:hypothetical protein